MPQLYAPFQPTLTKAGLTHFGINLIHSPVCKTLTGIVHSYLQVSIEKPTPYPVIPDGTQAIFMSIHGSLMGGSQTQARDIQLLEPGDYFGIRFHPGALRHFFDLNLCEITDQFVDSQYLSCKTFGTLHKAVYQSQHFYERASTCEKWLLKQFRPRPVAQFDHALALIYQSSGNMKIHQLATTVGWSHRHLNRLFQLHTGLSTKAFSQTIRFQQVCKQLTIAPNTSLSTAHEFGFFDQSHLIRDYKKRLPAKSSLFLEHFKSDFYNT